MENILRTFILALSLYVLLDKFIIKEMVRKGLEHIVEPYRSLIGKLLDALLFALGERLVSVVVYGSVARGQMRKNSDIDLLIVASGLPSSRFERVNIFIKAEDMLTENLEKLYEDGYSITFSPVIKTPEEAEKISILYLDMVEDGVIVHDKDSFFERILNRLSEKLKELGAERVWVGRKWYWRLKKDYRFGDVIIIE